MKDIVRVSTNGIPEGQDVRHWSAEVSRYLNKLEIEVSPRQPFAAELLVRTLGPTKVARVEAEYQHVRHRADDAEDRFEILYMEQGFMDIDHYGRRFRLGPKEWCIVDDRESYSFATSERCTCLVFQMPTPWARRFVPDLGENVINGLPASGAWSKSLGYAVEAVGSSEMPDASLEDVYIAEHLGGLLALATGKSIPNQTTHKAALMRSIKRSLFERFAETTLTAAEIATEHRISRRYLHMLFAEQGETFGQCLQSLRLSRARAMLTDTRYSKTSVAEVGFSVGFADPANFARQFRNAFGLRPSELKKKAN